MVPVGVGDDEEDHDNDSSRVSEVLRDSVAVIDGDMVCACVQDVLRV